MWSLLKIKKFWKMQKMNSKKLKMAIFAFLVTLALCDIPQPLGIKKDLLADSNPKAEG
jgi:hypothetical protein